jgi:hypothetical protein
MYLPGRSVAYSYVSGGYKKRSVAYSEVPGGYKKLK